MTFTITLDRVAVVDQTIDWSATSTTATDGVDFVAVLLVGRARFGWRGRKAVRVLYTGSLLLLLAYAGSRFVLEVVLRRAA